MFYTIDQINERGVKNTHTCHNKRDLYKYLNTLTDLKKLSIVVVDGRDELVASKEQGQSKLIFNTWG